MLTPVLELLSPIELHALSLVSKESRSICEPLLYSSIDWTWLEDRPPPIAAFIRTILRRPALATHVRRVSLLGASFIPYHKYRNTLPPKIDVAALDNKEAAKAIELTKVGFALSWEKELSRGEMDALVTLLLSQLHHITHLVLSPMFTFETALLRQLFYAALFKQNDHQLPTYQHLGQLDLNFSARRGLSLHQLVSTDLLPFFYLPVVQEFSLVSSMPMYWGKWTMQAPTSSVLTTLQLTAIEPKDLCHLLSKTPALKKLQYNWYYRSGVDQGRTEEGSVWVSLEDIGHALGHVRETLKELVITGKCSFEEDREWDFLDFQGTLKGFLELGCLKTLQIPLPFLTGNLDGAHAIPYDVIPRNLESLTITDDTFLEWPWESEWRDTVVSSAIERWYVLGEPGFSFSNFSEIGHEFHHLQLKHPRYIIY